MKIGGWSSPTLHPLLQYAWSLVFAAFIGSVLSADMISLHNHTLAYSLFFIIGERICLVHLVRLVSILLKKVILLNQLGKARPNKDF